MTAREGAPSIESRDVVIVKLGGSLITDKERPATARPEVIQRLAREIVTAGEGMTESLLVGHGSGSFGHAAASESGLGKGAYVLPGEAVSVQRRRGIAVTQDQAAQLHRLLVASLIEAGSSPYGWAASSALVARAGKPRRGQVGPLLHALEMGLLPVIYGDVVQDLEWGASICSTEALVSFLIGHLKRAGRRIRRVLWCGETDGIYDRSGQTIPTVDGSNLSRVRRQIVAARGIDVTGGMHLRLSTCRALARRGIESWLLNGLTPGLLESALRGEEVTGTRILASHSL